MKKSTSRKIIRCSVWTAWLASTIFTNGATAVAAPWLASAADAASDYLGGIAGNWASEDLRAEDFSPDSLGENGHLERLVSLAISAVILRLPELDKRTAPHASLCKDLADYLGDAWPALNKLNRPVPADTHGASNAWDEEIFDRLGGSELHKNILAYIREPLNADVFTFDLWDDIISGILLVKGIHIPEILHIAAAEALHRHLPRFLYEATKLAAAKFPEAYAAVQLRILEQQTEILESLHTHADELSEWLGVQFTDVKSALTQQAETHAKVAADLASLITKADTIDRKQDAQLVLLTHIFTRLAKLEISLADELIAIASKLAAQSEQASQHFQTLLAALAQIKTGHETLISLARQHSSELAAVRAELDQLKTQLTAALEHNARTARQTIDFAKPTDLPAAASKLFGRDTDLAALRPLFLDHKQIAITGTGGLGKTALCSEFLRQLSADPATQHLLANGIFIHDFYKQPTLQGFIASILGQARVDVRDPIERHATVIRILEQPGTVLYIEGGEKIGDLSVLDPFLSPSSHILFTTRLPKQPDHAEAYQLQPLAPDDAAHAIHHYAETEFQKKRRKPFPFPATDPGWTLLARDLGGLPLACRIAGHYCATRVTAPAEFHRLLESDGLTPIVTGTDSRNNLHILFTQSARALTPAALHAWSALTFGGASHTPLAILRAIGVTDDTALAILCDHGIATADFAPSPEDGKTEAAYALAHALLAEWGRRELDAIVPTPIVAGASRPRGSQNNTEPPPAESVPAAQGGETPPLPSTTRPTHAEVVEAAMMWALDYWEKFNEHPEIHCRPEQYRHTAPVAEGILREVEPLTELPANVRDTFYYLPARMHHHHGQFALAEPIYRRCIERMKTDSGELSAEYATAIGSLADLLQATNRLEETERLKREALKICEQIYEESQPEIAIALNNLATLYYSTNRLRNAEPLMRRALKIFKASYGEGHANVALQLNNLAQLLQETNRLGEAEPLMRRALEIDEASFGSMHPQVAIDLNNLATLYYATNRRDKSEPLMRRALAIDEASYGPLHPLVAIRLNNLAQLLQATKRLEEAEPMMRRALGIFKTSYGEGHPNVAVQLNNLVTLLQATNRLGEAEPLMRRALQIDEASFGSMHPKVAIRLNNLARLLQDTNRLEEAEPLMRRHLEIFLQFTAQTEHEHPHLRDAVRNYAELCQAMQVSREEIGPRLVGMFYENGISKEKTKIIFASVFKTK